MEIATLLAAVAALGLPCSNPELRDFPAEQMPWPAAYVRTIEGHNIIALREGTRDETQRLPEFSCMSFCIAGCMRTENDVDSRIPCRWTRARKWRFKP